jgi:16S rRNA (guanine1207-N2)-methyltransferase
LKHKNPNNSPYYQTRELSLEIGGLALQVRTKPGIPDWDQVRPSTALLAAELPVHSGEKLLLAGFGNGALAAALGRRLNEGELHILEDSYLAQRLTRETLQLHQVSNAVIHDKPFLIEQPAQENLPVYDRAAIDLPKGRRLARRRILEAHRLLKEGGDLYLAGANKEGIQAVIKDGEAVFGSQATIVGYKKGSRIARFRKMSSRDVPPDWAGEAGTAPGTWHEFALPEEELRIRSIPGVFSFEGIDEGSRLLLDHLPELEGKDILDFGCGSGVIGLVAARRGAASVDLIDISLSAVAAARENIRLNGTQNAVAFPSDVLEAVSERSYDLILSNPPFHTGHGVDYEIATTFITHAQQLLRAKGRLILVANQFIRYDRLMGTIFREARIQAETGKFHILSAQR